MERYVNKLKEWRERRKVIMQSRFFFSYFPAGGYPNNITWFLHSLGHSVTIDSMFAVVQGVRRECDGNVTAHSDSRKMGQPYILSS